MSILNRTIGFLLLAWLSLASAGAASGHQIAGYFRAVQMDDAGSVAKMLASGALGPNAVDPVSGESGLILAMREGSARVAAVLMAQPGIDLELKAPNGNTALMMAAFKHNTPAVTALLAKGAIVNRPGWTALHFAAASGDDEITKILLDHFAYIDAEPPGSPR